MDGRDGMSLFNSQKKFSVFSEFLFDEYIKSRLIKEIRHLKHVLDLRKCPPPSLKSL